MCVDDPVIGNRTNKGSANVLLSLHQTAVVLFFHSACYAATCTSAIIAEHELKVAREEKVGNGSSCRWRLQPGPLFKAQNRSSGKSTGTRPGRAAHLYIPLKEPAASIHISVINHHHHGCLVPFCLPPHTHHSQQRYVPQPPLHTLTTPQRGRTT